MLHILAGGIIRSNLSDSTELRDYMGSSNTTRHRKKLGADIEIVMCQTAKIKSEIQGILLFIRL
jgi:hypothetical protein